MALRETGGLVVMRAVREFKLGEDAMASLSAGGLVMAVRVVAPVTGAVVLVAPAVVVIVGRAVLLLDTPTEVRVVVVARD